MSDLSDEEPQLGIAVGPHHGVEPGKDPDGERHVDTASLLEHSTRRDEDTRANDGAHDDGAALDETKRCFQTHRLLLHLLNLLLTIASVNWFILTLVRHLGDQAQMILISRLSEILEFTGGVHMVALILILH